MKDAACELTEAQFLVALAVEATTAGAAGAVTFSAKLLSTSSPARPQPVADLGACPSSRARSKIEESFSLRPFSRPPSLVLRSTTGAIRGRCEEAVLGRIESHSLLFNRVALLGHTPRLAVPGVLVWPMLLAAGKVKRNELPLAVDWSSRFPSSSWASPSTNACP
jgi:hypothetical protein